MAGKASKGTTLKQGLVAVGNIVTIGGPSTTAATIDVTDHDSTWTEYAVGIKEGGDVSFDVNFNNTAGQEAVRDALGAAAQSYTIEPPGAGTVGFSGIVTAFQLQPGGVGDPLRASVTLKVTGAVTYTDPA